MPATTTLSAPSSAGSNPMSADTKELIKDVVSAYIGSLNPYVPHAYNVTHCLRDLVIALTRKIALGDDSYFSLLDDTGGLHGIDGTAPPSSSPSPEDDSTNESLSPTPSPSKTPHEHSSDHKLKGLSSRTIATLEAFLSSCLLSLPSSPLSNNPTATPSPHPTSSPSANPSLRQRRHDQFRDRDLAVRLRLYCRRIAVLPEFYRETDKSVGMRVSLVVRSFVGTAGCVGSLRPCLSRLVRCLTMEILGVDVLGEQVVVLIKRLISEYESKTSNSLDFLSTREKSAEQYLAPLLKAYITHLQSHHESLINDCDIEWMLSHSLDSELRKTFKNAEFHSVKHLHNVCHDHASQLNSILLQTSRSEVSGSDGRSSPTPPLFTADSKTIRQALKDLKRETITVNGDILPTVNSVKELVALLTSTLNERTNSLPTPLLTSEVVFLKKGIDSEESSLCSDLEGEASVDGRVPDVEPNVRIIGPRRNWEERTINKLVCRLLFAASRTGVGGDAYFVVRDLFGGDDVIVVPSSQKKPTAPHGTIEILVRLTSITIKCHSSYDIYPRAAFDNHTSSQNPCAPLVQLRTVTQECISLQTVRARDVVAGECCFKKGEEEVEWDENGLLLREKVTEETGERILSVVPVGKD